MADIDKIIERAEKDLNILAIGTEGSGNDPNQTPDEWTDLDVTLFAAKPAQVDAMGWVNALGTPKLVQHLYDMHLFGPATGAWQSWLTRYQGTRRIDWKIAPSADEAAYLAGDHLNAIIWRQGKGRVTPRKTDAASHFLPVPTQADYESVLNEFFWVAGNVVKGLSRNNLLYANEQVNAHLRPQILKLFAYRQTLEQDGHFDPGVKFKNVWNKLMSSERNQLAATYDQSSRALTLASLKNCVAIVEGLVDEFNDDLTLLRPVWLGPADDQVTSWLFDLTTSLNTECDHQD
ncbi:aminoglycoside 6-adenylyltransferase [Lacticaseibacillus sp. GG6-2]